MTSPRRVTLADVARRAGVSRTTASFVVNDRTDMRISESAQRAVLQAVADLDYRPNHMARSLRTSRSQTVALVSDALASDPYAGQVVYGAVAAALQHERVLLLAETEGDHDLEERVVEDFLARRVDGFVYATTYTRDAKVPLRLRDQPLVLLNCSSADVDAPAVLPDERTAGRDALDVLLDAGHREDVWVVGEPAPAVFAGRERLLGLTGRARAADVDLAGVLACEWDPASGFEAVADALDSGLRPRAFVCLNDRIALGAYQALQERGLRVGADVSVVSFDDTELASWLRPPLTSIALPHSAMGRLAVELLLGDAPPGETKVPMPVRHRASVGPPRR